MRTGPWIVAAGPFLLAAVLLQASPSPGAGPFAFPHRPHLSPETVEAALSSEPGAAPAGGKPGGAVDRDCRVCHDYGRGPGAHLEGCTACHQGEGNLEVVRRPVAPSGRRPFAHAEHLRDRSLSCFSCHRPLMENDWLEFSVPAPGLGPGGSGGRPGGASGGPTCADCHAAHDPAGEAVPQYATTGDGKRCADCHRSGEAILPLALRPGREAPRAGEARPFRHEDHGGVGTPCLDCHEQVRESRRVGDYEAATAMAPACAACHLADAERTPLAGKGSPPRTTTIPFRAFGNFSHAAHLAPEGRHPVSGKPAAGCLTCHYPAEDPQAPEGLRRAAAGAEPAGRATLVDYDSCLPCHGPWRVEGHGVGPWSCFRCHAPAEDRPGHLPLALAAVERPRVRSVALRTHPHPGITTEGPALRSPREEGGKECRECHLAAIPAIPSRRTGRGFRHEPHLPAAPEREDCLRCHPTAATASWSEDLGAFDPAACAACHLGTGPADLGLEMVRREVRRFDHAAHAGPGRRPSGFEGYGCGECHEAGGEVGYAVKPAAADCSLCHSHDAAEAPEKAARTGPKTRGEGEPARCVPCHLATGPGGDPAATWSGRPPEHREVLVVHLDLLPGTQWHDRSAREGDASGGCAACHERDALAGKPPDYRERIESARVARSIHDDPSHRGAWFNDPALQKRDGSGDPGGKGRTCWTCHRQDPRGYLRALESR